MPCVLRGFFIAQITGVAVNAIFMANTYSQSDRERLVTAVCDVMTTDSVSLRQACVIVGVPASTILSWIDQSDILSEQYARARGDLIDSVVGEILEIADHGENDTYTTDEGLERTNTDVIQRSRLRVDTRKWLLSKMMPKKFGDKLQTENNHTGKIETVLTQTDKTEIARIAKKLDNEY